MARYVVIRTEGGTTFKGELSDLYARWSYVDVEETSQITFEGSWVASLA